MSKEIRHELDEDQYERLSDLKDRRGYTWKGLLLEGAEALEDGDFGENRIDGLTYDPEQDRRVYPDPDDDRLGSFKAGWTKAENGERFSSGTLEQLSWHNLGWRLGTLFGPSSAELKRELYTWCVEQQREADE